MKDLYDPSTIKIPETNNEFWLALLRARNYHLPEAQRVLAKTIETTGRWDETHIATTWHFLDNWLNKAFARWDMPE